MRGLNSKLDDFVKNPSALLLFVFEFPISVIISYFERSAVLIKTKQTP